MCDVNIENLYINKLADIFSKYNNTYHSTAKIKPADVSPSKYIHLASENNDKYAKF